MEKLANGTENYIEKEAKRYVTQRSGFTPGGDGLLIEPNLITTYHGSFPVCVHIDCVSYLPIAQR